MNNTDLYLKLFTKNLRNLWELLIKFKHSVRFNNNGHAICITVPNTLKKRLKRA